MTTSLLTPWLLDQIRDGNAILFLGAGATYGAIGPNGEKPLNGDELRDKVSDEFLGGSLKDRGLSEVSEYAKNESSLHDVHKFIYKLFEPLSPAPYHTIIPSFRWQAIVTTNYDFIIERAYQKLASRLQSPIRISENGDADRADLGNPLSVPLLKLHGCLSAITDDSPPLILSTEEYARHREKRERVFGLFADWATIHPIVFCGYKIGDPNIQQILFDLGDRSINRPQYAVVDPYLNEFDLRYWQSRRFIPQKLTFERFLDALDDGISENKRKLSILRSPHTSSINSRVMRGTPSSELLVYIENELNHIHEGMSISAVDPRDFYRGSGDSWYAIASSLDVERRFVDEFLLTAVLDQPSDNRLETYLLKGHAGSGKSIALRRAAWNAAVHHGAFVFWLNKGARIDIDFVRQLYNLTEERIFVFVEDALPILDNIRTVSNVSTDELLPVTLTFGARTNEWNITDEVHEQILSDSFELTELNDREIERLLDRLDSHGCLGHLTTLNDEERRDHFRLTAQRQLLVALHEATFGKLSKKL